jgi:hypothetical protein
VELILFVRRRRDTDEVRETQLSLLLRPRIFEAIDKKFKG